ncbi:SDR family oxidoreductase [Streptomyces sp. NPDC048484]|uniref:SDR family NAD(P)-dependent oxidoreductase n=1 Tax=Streptomyces sp. NPDC048484 TaxID=3155146 RepID=UPI003448B1D7
MTTQKIALITGANRGIGRSTALALARIGAKIVVTHRSDEDGAAQTVRMIRDAGSDAVALRLDISEVTSFTGFTTEMIEQIHTHWGSRQLDILVNNAGIGLFGPLEDVTVQDFDAVVGTNFRGTFFLIQALAQVMSDGGRIINVSTSMTRHTSPATALYTASKAAVEAFSRSLAVELGPRGIRINSIAPGPTATDFNGGAMRDSAALREGLAAQTALGRVGKPDEIGEAIASLASDGMRWITAERIEVSGGALL